MLGSFAPWLHTSTSCYGCQACINPAHAKARAVRPEFLWNFALPSISSSPATSPPTQQHWPKAAASAAIFRDGKVLIGLRGKDPRRQVWSLPGGHIEPGETAKGAALRELHEETSVSAELHGLIDINDVIIRSSDGALQAHYLLTIFFGTWVSGEPVAGDDCLAARFVSPDEIDNLEATDRLRHFVKLGQSRWHEFSRTQAG